MPVTVTVTVPGTVTAKVRQRAYWGSIEWIRSFARRTHVVGAFGNLKNRNTENITRGWIQVSGDARTSLMLAIAASAYNLRVARRWNAMTGASCDPLLEADLSVLGWREVTAEGTKSGDRTPHDLAATDQQDRPTDYHGGASCC